MDDEGRAVVVGDSTAADGRIFLKAAVFNRFAISATLAYSLIAAYSNFPPNRMHANSHLPRSGSRKTVSEDAK